jgi:hypothetical protein
MLQQTRRFNMTGRKIEMRYGETGVLYFARNARNLRPRA